MKYFVLFLILSCSLKISLAQSGQSEYKQVNLSKIPKPVAPAKLVISDIAFSDKSGNANEILDASENAEITFTLENKGSGDAYNLFIKVQDDKNMNGLVYAAESMKGNLSAGKKVFIKIPVSASLALKTGKSNFTVQVTEGNRFDSEPFVISFKTQEFRKPEIVIADAVFTNKGQEGKIMLGELVQLTVIIQNRGQGEAKNINIDFTNPTNVFPGGQETYTIETLKPNEHMKISYEFFANKKYAKNEIPITVTVKESYGRYGLTDIKSVSLEKSLAKAEVVVDGQDRTGGSVIIGDVSILPDVDKNIPVTGVVNSNRYALIIGNEEYSKYQPDLGQEVNVDFAKNDSKIFRDYCEKTLGIPLININYIADGTAAKMKQGIDRMNLLMKNSNSKLEVIFYYAGHGFPDAITQEPYLMPVDVSSNNLSDAIKLNDVCSKLSEFPSDRVTMFIDACFSGGARNGQLGIARSVKIAPKSTTLNGNLVIFSASSGTQTSMAYRDKQHGIYTYFLLKTLQESKGDITYEKLNETVKQKVKFESIRVNSKEQEPQVNTSSEVSGIWSQWKINKQ